MPFDADFIADPYPRYASLRERAPVSRVRVPDGSLVWLVTPYAEVRAALADPRLSLDKSRAGEGGYRGFALPPALDANLLNMDPPDHTRLRRLVMAGFTQRRVEALRPRVGEIADDLIDGFAEAGRTELMAEFAGPLPVLVIAELLGVPAEGRGKFRSWTDILLVPGTTDPGEARRRQGAAVSELAAFLTDLIDVKRHEPGSDLLSALLAVRDEDDSRLSEDELTSLAFLLLFAGYESPVHHIGNIIRALLTDPALEARVRADPQALAAASEEVLRYDTPGTLAIRRFAIEPLTIAGQPIPAGDTVMLAIGAANRDPAQFAHPDTITIDRPGERAATGHVAFGHGIHHCLGASLARMETTVAVGALLRRLPEMRLAVPADQLTQRGSFRNRGLATLPVVFSDRATQP